MGVDNSQAEQLLRRLFPAPTPEQRAEQERQAAIVAGRATCRLCDVNGWRALHDDRVVRCDHQPRILRIVE